MMATITCSQSKTQNSDHTAGDILCVCQDNGGTHLDGPDGSLSIHPENQLPVTRTHHHANLNYVRNLYIITNYYYHY